LASGPLNPKGLGAVGGFNANMGADPFALRTVQGESQHYARQRAGRTIIRPVLKGRGAARTVPFDQLTYIDADNPAVNYYAATAYTAYSTVAGSFGNKKKILLRLARPQTPGVLTYFMAILNGIYQLNCAAQFTAAGVATLELGLTLNVRAVPIVSDFDPESIVWNDYAGLSLGTYFSTQWGATGQTEISGTLNPTSQTIDKSVSVTWGVNDEPSLAMHGSVGADETLYGLALEVAAPGTGTPSTTSATLTMRPTLTSNPSIFEGYRSGIVLSHTRP